MPGLSYSKFNRTLGLILLLFLNFFSSLPTTVAQSSEQNVITYVSPLPGSKDNLSENNIIVRLKKQYKAQPINLTELFKVTGNITGEIVGRVILSDDGKTIIFTPSEPFKLGEIIQVDVSKICSNNETAIKNDKFAFSVAEYSINKNYSLDLFFNVLGMSKNILSDTDTLPPNYPELEIELFDSPFPEKLFISLFGGTAYPANLIIENNGNPIYYNELISSGIDFKKQPDGTITFFNTQKNKFYALNSSYAVVDSFECDNGFETDVHELLVLPNGNAYLLGIDPRIIDMSVIVPGGKMNAQVIGFLIQEIDRNKNAVFQWKSLDHIPVTDASESVDLTAQVIDYIHSNSIDIDHDGNLILSSRNLDEITKISRQTGEIIWRMGGKGSEFTFINEDLEFFHQHDARRISNGNILFFDNGNLRTPRFSRAVEYALDETNLTATLVWEHRNTPDLYAAAMGSARRLANGNTLINWVRGGYITEVRPDGTPALIIKYPEDVSSYRAIKDDWKTTLFTASFDTLDFGSVEIGSIVGKEFSIDNNSADPTTLTGIYHTNDVFAINQTFPVIIPSNDNITLQIFFSPVDVNLYIDTLNLRSDSESSLINSQMIIKGFGMDVSSTGNEETRINNYSLTQNYPNPFNPSTKINWHLANSSFVSLKVYDLLGREVAVLVNGERSAGNYETDFSANELSTGVYIYTLNAIDKSSGILFTDTKKMCLIK